MTIEKVNKQPASYHCHFLISPKCGLGNAHYVKDEAASEGDGVFLYRVDCQYEDRHFIAMTYIFCALCSHGIFLSRLFSYPISLFYLSQL